MHCKRMVSHSVAVHPPALSLSRWGTDCKWECSGCWDWEGLQFLVVLLEQDRPWERAGAAAPRSRAEPGLSDWAPPLGFQQVVWASTDGAITTPLDGSLSYSVDLFTEKQVILNKLSYFNRAHFHKSFSADTGWGVCCVVLFLIFAS